MSTKTPQVQPAVPVRVQRIGTAGIFSVFLIVFLFIIWGIFVELDEGVLITGEVTAEGNRVTVRHNAGGKVVQIFYKEGDVVKEGEQLVELDQRALRNERRFLGNQLANINDQILQLDEGIQLRISQLESMKKEQAVMRELVKSGFFAESKLRDVERSLIEIQQEILSNRRAKSNIQGQRIQILSKLATLDEAIQKTVVFAPIDGTIVLANVKALGTLVEQGTVLFEILPSNKQLIVEGYLPQHLARRISVTTPVVLRFPTIRAKEFSTIHGEVSYVSSDAIDLAQGSTGYLVRVKSEQLDQAGPNIFPPGFPSEVLVQTGKHTVFEYLTSSIATFKMRSMN